MLGLVFLEICESALAKNSRFYGNFESNNVKESSSNCDSNASENVLEFTCKEFYYYKHDERIKLIFTNVKEKFMSKEEKEKEEANREGGFIFEDKDKRYKFEVITNLVSDVKKLGDPREGTEEQGHTFGYLDENYRIYITKEDIKTVLEEGIVIPSVLYKNPNLYYLRVPIFFKPYNSFFHDKVVKFNNAGFQYHLYFEELFNKYLINLSKEKLKFCERAFFRATSLSQSEFNKMYKDKIFLLANHNIDLYEQIFKILLKNISENSSQISFLDRVLESIRPLLYKVVLSSFYPHTDSKNAIARMHPQRRDTFGTKVIYGILTDILNLIRSFFDKTYVFEFYELFVTYEEIVMPLVLDLKIKYEHWNTFEKKDLDVETELGTTVRLRHVKTYEGGVNVKLNLEDSVEERYCSLRVHIINGTKVYSTNWISFASSNSY